MITNLKHLPYQFYFYLYGFFLGGGRYILIDIDNTVTDQLPRLQRTFKNGVFDYQKSISWAELIKDEPFLNSPRFLREISSHFHVLWFTSRNIRAFPATLYWLWINHFPISALVCTGSMVKKIEFIKIFSRKHAVQYIVDDMKEGYEFGSPVYVQEYKDFLEKGGYAVFEDLQSIKKHLEGCPEELCQK